MLIKSNKDKLDVEISIRNRKDNAYNTKVILSFSPNINYVKAEVSCLEFLSATRPFPASLSVLKHEFFSLSPLRRSALQTTPRWNVPSDTPSSGATWRSVPSHFTRSIQRHATRLWFSSSELIVIPLCSWIMSAEAFPSDVWGKPQSHPGVHSDQHHSHQVSLNVLAGGTFPSLNEKVSTLEQMYLVLTFTFLVLGHSDSEELPSTLNDNAMQISIPVRYQAGIIFSAWVIRRKQKMITYFNKGTLMQIQVISLKILQVQSFLKNVTCLKSHQSQRKLCMCLSCSTHVNKVFFIFKLKI